MGRITAYIADLIAKTGITWESYHAQRVEKRACPSRSVSVAVCFCSTLSSDSEIRASMPPRPPDVAQSATRVVLSGSSRDCRRASRSGGATKITVSLMGEARAGFSAGIVAGGAVRAGLIAPVIDRSPVRAVVRCSRVACRWSSVLSFFFKLLLIEQLPAHNAIDLCTQFRNTIFIRKLHFGLPADQARQDIVAKGKIGAGRD